MGADASFVYKGAGPSAACGLHATCARIGLGGVGMECCPTEDGTFLPCCPLSCFYDGVRCMPSGRVDVLADLACEKRLQPDGRPHWDLSQGAGRMLCQYNAD